MFAFVVIGSFYYYFVSKHRRKITSTTKKTIPDKLWMNICVSNAFMQQFAHCALKLWRNLLRLVASGFVVAKYKYCCGLKLWITILGLECVWLVSLQTVPEAPTMTRTLLPEQTIQQRSAKKPNDTVNDKSSDKKSVLTKHTSRLVAVHPTTAPALRHHQLQPELAHQI